MPTLKIFCQQGHKHCKCGNFGDKLTAFLLQKLTAYSIESVSYRHIKEADLIGIGSILQRVPEDYSGIIWSSGFLEDNTKIFSKANIFAIRGKLSLNKINGKTEHTILGDGGLLCYLMASKLPKKYKLGIIPHYIDKNLPLIKQMASNPEIKVIDICGSCDDIIKEVQQCDYVISSSLHGCVVADSLNIPNEWIKLSNKVKGNGFKFKDYYSAFGMENKTPMILSANDNLDSILNKLQGYERKNIDVVKSQLLESIKAI